MIPARLSRFLDRHRKFGLDTSPFIYHLAGHPPYLELTEYIFGSLERPGWSGITSVITILEILVQPYRSLNRTLVNAAYALLSTYPRLEWAEVSLEVVDLAARLRARHNLRTPDALHAATAIHFKASGFISNDAVFGRVGELEVLLLDEVLD